MPCTIPPVIPNGRVVGDLKQEAYQIGERLQFQCNSGYVFQFSPYVQCRSDGTWEGGACVPRSCGDPGNVTNAERKGLAFVFPESVTYRCARGYAGSQANMQTFCGTRGEWVPPVSRFSCRLIHCLEQLLIDNGSVDCDGTTVDSVAKYTCDPGFRLVGVRERVCMENGQWSDESPKCVPGTCRNPGPYPGGIVVPDQDEYEVNDLVIFKCGTEHIMSKCLGEDKWTTVPDTPCESGGVSTGSDIFPNAPEPPTPALPSEADSLSWTSKLISLSKDFVFRWGIRILVSLLVLLLGYAVMVFFTLQSHQKKT